MNALAISVFVDIVITLLFIWNLEKLKEIYLIYIEQKELFLRVMYLFVKFIWYLFLTFTYLYVILSYIIKDEIERENMNLLIVKLSILAYIVEHIIAK
tara:strand:+ start:333 stop:626 length:294 start_codon:yes stop_codon:yes gene_type:complete